MPTQPSSQLQPPDEHEAGGHAEAVHCWSRLQALSLDEDEVRFVDLLRELYRNSQPLTDPAGFVAGGSLFFQGGNMRIAGDDGRFYELWRQLGGLALGWRTGPLSGSSHASIVDQYEIRLHGAGCVLVGVADHPGVPGGVHTWAQSERHAATGNALQSIAHGLSWVDHKRHGNQQVGAFGYSPYSEKSPPNNPLVVQRLPELPPGSTSTSTSW
jgi:hypothetical protein